MKGKQLLEMRLPVCKCDMFSQLHRCVTGVFVRSVLWIYVKELVPTASDRLSSVVFCAVSSVSHTL
jgi:hypothetical protein